MPITRKFRKKTKKTRRNPDEGSGGGGGGSSSGVQPIKEVGEFLLPAFGAFVATRFGTRAVATTISNRWPTYAKHAGAIASLASFGAAWLAAHRVRMLERHAEALTIGAGIAAGQTLVQMYLPKLAWVVSDATPDLTDASSATTQIPATTTDDPTGTGDFEVLDDSYGAQSWGASRDAGDPGAYRTPAAANKQRRQEQAAAQSAMDPDFDFSDDISDMMENSGSLSP